MKVHRGQFIVTYPLGTMCENKTNREVAQELVEALKEGKSIVKPDGPWKVEVVEVLEVKPEDITEEMIEKWESLMSHGRGAWDMVDHKELMAAAINVFLQEPKEV